MLGTNELELLETTAAELVGIVGTPKRREILTKAFERLRTLHYESRTMHKIELVGEGELSHCTVCNGAEGSIPSMCPGRKMTEQEEQAVYAGELDFANHQWMRRCDVKHRPDCDRPGNKWCKCHPIPFGF